MPTVNIHEKYAKKIQTEYVLNSLVRGKLNNNYSFEGVRTVKITTPLTVPYNDYNRTLSANRYGTPEEMEDRIQELTMSQDKSFALIIDKGNQADQQGVKGGAKMLRLQIAEQGVPMIDRYIFGVLGENAGSAVVGAALTEQNVVSIIADATARLDDYEVPSDSRTLWISAQAYKALRLSDQFIAVEALGKKSLSKGEVGEFDNMTVIKVPSKRFPDGMQFLIVHKAAATAPHKIHDAKLHTDPPGISGNLLEGRDYYDCFIFAPKAVGVYSYFTGRTKTSTPTISGATLAGGGTGAVYHYTLDSSDPRFSNTVQTGTATGATSGQTVKAFAQQPGNLKSDVATFVIA